VAGPIPLLRLSRPGQAAVGELGLRMRVEDGVGISIRIGVGYNEA
jgi:hypothetical protein